MLAILCLNTVGLLGCGEPAQSAPKPTPAPLQIVLAGCSDHSVVHTTFVSERQATVRAKSNGQTLPAYETRNDQRVDAAFEVLDCRGGVPQRLRVRYGEVTERHLDPAARPADAQGENAPPEPTFTVERHPLANRTFQIVQAGESVLVVGDDGSPAAPLLAAHVLAREDVDGGAVPLPGDPFARLIATASPKPGLVIAVDEPIAKSLLARDETGSIRATLMYIGLEPTPEGSTRARFNAHFTLHDESQPGTLRDADLTGTLTIDPQTARPLTLDLSGTEHALSTTSDVKTMVEREVNGTWRVRRSWEWR